jgi:nucleoside-diphosphate-sugar epimerase
MRILLTGANGFLGKILCNGLVQHELTTLGRSDADVVANLATSIPVLNKQFDLVIHAAGLAHVVPRQLDEINLFHQVNVVGTEHLLQGLERSGIPGFFVFISSVSVYGLESGVNVTEDAPLLATDPYGKSKIAAEVLVKNWCDRHNVICTILRLPLIAGPHPPGNLGFMIKALKSRFYFDIGGGKSRKSIVLARDIALFIIPAAQKGGTYNLTDGEHPTFRMLSEHIANLLGKSYVPNMPYWMAFMIAKVGDWLGKKAPLNSVQLKKITATLTFSDEKARLSFGWNPTRILEGFKIDQSC